MIRCEEVLKLLYQYIDGQLDEIKHAEIEEHIKLCRHCCRHHDFEIELRNLVARSCYQKKAPESLKKKIDGILGDLTAE